MLSLNKLQLSNFLSHENTVLEFKPNQKLLLDGKSGAGKSSIVDALIWVLYGKGRVDNRSLIRKGKKTARVELILEDAKDEDIIIYKIERSVNDKGKNELTVQTREENGRLIPIPTTGLKDTQDYLEKNILHSSYLLFINSIAYPQDNVENFVKQPAGKRKDIILEIIKATDYDEYYEKTREKITELNLEKSSSDSLISTLEQMITDDHKTADDLPKIEKAHSETKDKITKSEIELENLRKEKEKIVIALTELNEKNKRYVGVETQLNSLKTEVKNIAYELTEISDLSGLERKKLQLNDLTVRQRDYIEWLDRLNKLISLKPIDKDYDSLLAEANKQLIHLMSHPFKDDSETIVPIKCKQCGFEDKVIVHNQNFQLLKQERENRIKELEISIQKYFEEKNEYQQRNDVYNEKVKELGPQPKWDSYAEKLTLETLEKEIKGFEGIIQRKNELNTLLPIKKVEIEALDKEYEELRKQIGNIAKLSAEKYNLEEKEKVLNNQLYLLQSDLNSIVQGLSLAKNALSRLESNQVKVNDLKETQKAVNGKIEALSLLKEAFSQTGIKAILIDFIIPKLEDRINSILSQLSDFRVRLDTQKSGITEGTVLEGLFINIFNEFGEEFDFDSYSGGERLKIIVAISEALSEVQNISFRILDELFVGLDEESTEKFSEVMTSLQERFNQMICISHLRNIKDLFDEKIMIIKHNGVSGLS